MKTIVILFSLSLILATFVRAEQLEEVMGGPNPGMHIHSPSPSMMGLNNPASPIMDVRPLEQRMYGNPRVTAPGGYNHIQYYYGRYNYMRQPYPYLPYRGNSSGNRNPGYFNWNNNRRDQNREEPQRRFGTPRIINKASKLAEKVEGQFKTRKFLQFWVQSVGVTTPPPSIQDGEMAVFLNTPKEDKARVIKKVEERKEDGKTKDILVSFEEREIETPENFYQGTLEEKKSLLSVAIFGDVNVPVRFRKLNSDSEDDTDEETGSDFQSEREFLDSEVVFCRVKDFDLWKHHHGSNITVNVSVTSSDRVERLKEYLDFRHPIRSSFSDMDYDREVSYLTGRIYKAYSDANEKGDREIMKVKDVRVGSDNGIKHDVIIQESLDSRIDLTISRIRDEEKEGIYFKGHWVKVEKPRKYLGNYQYSLRRPPSE